MTKVKLNHRGTIYTSKKKKKMNINEKRQFSNTIPFQNLICLQIIHIFINAQYYNFF